MATKKIVIEREEELQKAVGLPVVGMVPYEVELQKLDSAGRSLLEMPDDAQAVKAADRIIERIAG